MDNRSKFANAIEIEAELPAFEPLERRPTARQNDNDLRSMIETLADESGAAVGELEQQLSLLRDELAQLKAEIAVERAIKNDSVVELPNWRARDASAA